MKTQNHGKLNLNSLIYTEKINKSVENDGIKVTVVTKEIYKDNERYNIEVKNLTDKTVLIDTRRTSNSIYLLGNNGIKYNSNIDEISTTMHRIPSSIIRTYRLKFYKNYSSGIESMAIVFSDIVPDYEKYISNDNEESKRVVISVPI